MKRVLISAIAVIVVLAAVGVGISQFGAPSAEAAQGRPDDPGPPAPEQLKLELLIELSQSDPYDPTGRQRSSASISDITRLITKIGSSSENGFIIDSFFDVYYVSNIGSSGLDGVSFDSFFDIVYSFDERTKHTIPVEMVALSLSPNPPKEGVGLAS